MAGGAVEAHFGEKGIDGVLFDLIELYFAESQTGQRVAKAREPNVVVAHEGFVVFHWIQLDAFGCLVTGPGQPLFWHHQMGSATPRVCSGPCRCFYG
jgi:hypothetical protein